MTCKEVHDPFDGALSPCDLSTSLDVAVVTRKISWYQELLYAKTVLSSFKAQRRIALVGVWPCKVRLRAVLLQCLLQCLVYGFIKLV